MASSALISAANSVYGDFAVPGVPASGAKPLTRAEVRALFGLIDAALGSLGVNGAITVKKASRALLYADLAHAADALAVVYNDPTPAYNGIYAKVGDSGSGSWSLTALALPSSFAADLSQVLASIEQVEGDRDRAETAADAADADRVQSQAARDLAIAAAADAAQVSGVSVPIYASLPSAAAATIPAAVKSVRVQGYASPVDGVVTDFARAVSEPSHAGKFRSQDRFLPDGTTDAGTGGWFEYVPGPAGVDCRVTGAGLGAADDTSALTAALGIARAKKTRLNLVGADYTISDNIVLDVGDDVDGGLFARIVQITAGKGVFDGLDKDNVRIRNLIIDGPGSQHLIGGSDIKAAVVVQGGENARLENLHISGFYNGVNVCAGENKRVSGCVIKDFRIYGVVASLCDGFRIQNCVIGECSQTGAANGYCISATGDVVGGDAQNDNFITDNLLYGVPCWDAVMTHEVSRLQCRGNIIKDVRVGFDISAASAVNPLFDIVIADNIIEMTTTNTWGSTGAQHAGIYIGGVPGAYIDGVVIHDNIIVGANKIAIPGGSIGGNLPAAIQLQYVHNANVHDNVVRELGNIASYNAISVFRGGDNVAIRNNSASGVLSNGYMVRAQGVSTADVARNLSIQNNVTTCPVIAHTHIQNLTATRLSFTGNGTAALATLLSTSGADLIWQNGYGSFTPNLKIGGVALASGSYTTRLGEFVVRDGFLTQTITIVLNSKEGKSGDITIDGLAMPTRPGSDGMSYPFAVSNPTGVSGVPMATIAAGGSSTIAMRNNATDTNLTGAHLSDAARFVLQGGYPVST